MTWTFQLTDRQGTPLTELRNARDRSLRFPLGRTPTLSFTVDATHPAGPLLLALDKTLVNCFDDSSGSKVLRMRAVVIGYQKQRQSEGSTIQVTAAGLQWRLDHRLVGKHVNGATDGTNATTLKDRGTIMGDLLDAVNAGDASSIWADGDNTAIRRGTITASSSTYIGPWRYKPVGEAYAELAGTLDGPDWQVRYADPPTSDATGVVLGYLDVSAAIGTTRPDVVFAYGTQPGNVETWTDVGDANGLANRAVNLPPGWPDTATDQPVAWDDATSIADRGLYEAVVAADLQTFDLRQKLTQEHVRIRKVPRRVISFQPVAEDPNALVEQRRVPRLFTDFNVGDVVRFRAVERFDVTAADGTVIGQNEVPTADLLVRVFAADLSIDPNGVASTSLTLIQET